MPLILVAEDEPAMRRLLRERLQDAYEIIETGEPAEALALAVKHQPACVLLDLMLPKYTGLELCQTLAYHSVTRLIPILVITGQPAALYKQFCLNLGAKDYIEKPVDFRYLRTRLEQVIQERQPQRRSDVRIPLRVPLKLKGKDTSRKEFELFTVTENVSAGGFLCSCSADLQEGATVEVFCVGGNEVQTGSARVVHIQWRNTQLRQYGFQFLEKPRGWILR